MVLHGSPETISAQTGALFRVHVRPTVVSFMPRISRTFQVHFNKSRIAHNLRPTFYAGLVQLRPSSEVRHAADRMANQHAMFSSGRLSR